MNSRFTSISSEWRKLYRAAAVEQDADRLCDIVYGL
jgi:hypothetical protein